MSNEREPLTDADVELFIDEWCNGGKHAAHAIRDYYESLITSGKLRVVEEVEWDRKKPGCAKCGHPWSMLLTISACCPGCGNPIKRQSPADQVEKRG